MKRALLLALLMLAAISGDVQAATPFAGLPAIERPAPGVKLVTASGLTALPTGDRRVVAPGARITLDVRRSVRRGAVTLALSRISTKGRAISTVKRGRLRSGRFTVAVPSTPGARYRFRVGSGGFYLAAQAPVPPPAAPSPAAPTPAPTPTPVSPPWDAAPTGPPAAELATDRSTYAPGESVGVTLRNTGGTWLTHGMCPGFERSTPAGWVNGNTEPVPCPAALAITRPGGSYQSGVTIPAASPPGRYRATITVTPIGPSVSRQPIVVAAEFDVG